MKEIVKHCLWSSPQFCPQSFVGANQQCDFCKSVVYRLWLAWLIQGLTGITVPNHQHIMKQNLPQHQQASSVHRQASTGRNMSCTQMRPTQAFSSSSQTPSFSTNPIALRFDDLKTFQIIGISTARLNAKNLEIITAVKLMQSSQKVLKCRLWNNCRCFLSRTIRWDRAWVCGVCLGSRTAVYTIAHAVVTWTC